MLYQLDQDSVGARRMQESDQMSACSGSRCAVDESDPFGFEASEFGFEVVGSIGDVMQGLPTALEEAAHGAIGAEGLEEFDGAREGDTDTLGFERFGVGTVLAGKEFEVTATLFDRVNGDRHVIEWTVRRRGWHHQ